MSLNPKNGYVIIRREQQTMSEGGIYLPESSNVTGIGEVVAVSEGEMDHGLLVEPCVWPGDKVMFSTYDPMTVNSNGEKLLAIKQRDIVAVIK